MPGFRPGTPAVTITPEQITATVEVETPNTCPRCGFTSLLIFTRQDKAVDLDLRGTGSSQIDALDEAFRRIGVPRDQFEITKWGKTAEGKSFPVEWRVTQGPNAGAEVNIDWPHAKNGPEVPHVGYQTAGKRGSGGAVRGHILLDLVNCNR